MAYHPRTIIYVDGFNLYYGAVKNTPHKWLNLQRYFEMIRQNDDVLASCSGLPDDDDLTSRIFPPRRAHVPHVGGDFVGAGGRRQQRVELEPAVRRGTGHGLDNITSPIAPRHVRRIPQIRETNPRKYAARLLARDVLSLRS